MLWENRNGKFDFALVASFKVTANKIVIYF